jgi:hypothetical protein
MDVQHLIYWQGQRVCNALLKWNPWEIFHLCDRNRNVPRQLSTSQEFFTSHIFFMTTHQCHGSKMCYKEYFIHIFYIQWHYYYVHANVFKCWVRYPRKWFKGKEIFIHRSIWWHYNSELPHASVGMYWSVGSEGHSEPAPTSAPSTGCPLLLSCGWTSIELIFGFILGTNFVGDRSHISVDR